jgi:hypothetical protein
MTRDEVEHIFTYHAPKNENVKADHEKVGEITKNAALDLVNLLPECPEATLALRHLQMARMMANAAIALNQEPM